MKKLIIISAAVFSLSFATTNTLKAQAGGIAKGEMYVNWKFPDSIDVSKTVTFPTMESLAPSWASDSVDVSVEEFYTYLSLDTLRGTRRVKLSTEWYISGGAQLVIDAPRDTTSRDLVIVQSSGNDTLTVSDGRQRGLLFYTGSQWVPVGNISHKK